MFHTRIFDALQEPSTWLAIVGGVTAAAALPVPFNWITAVACVPGAVLRERGGVPPTVS